MRILVDESGDCGMKLGKSSPTFSLAAVVFETEAGASACEEAIAQLKIDLHVTEFHFVHLGDAPRKAFLQAICAHDFIYVVQTLVKGRLVARDWQKKVFFYDRVAERLADGVEELLRIAHASREPAPLNAKVVADRNNDKDYMRALGEHFRRFKDGQGRSLVEKVSARRSVAYNLLQLADMICGAVGHPGYGKIIEKKKLAEVQWP